LFLSKANKLLNFSNIEGKQFWCFLYIY
jgi:hypothetical protein